MCADREQYLEYLVLISKIEENISRINYYLCTVGAFVAFWGFLK